MKLSRTLLLFLTPAMVFAQEVCEEKSSIEELGKNTESAILWTHCEKFGIKDKSVLSDPKNIHYLVLRNYRQKSLLLEDPIGDYALANGPSSNFQSALRTTLGVKKKSLSDDEYLSAKLCAKVLFDLEDEAPVELGVSEIEIYRDSSQYLEDKKLLEEVLIRKSNKEKQKIMELFESGKLVVESRKTPINVNGLSLDLIRIIEEEEKNGIPYKKGDSHKWSEQFKKEKKFFSNQTIKSLPSKMLAALSGGKSVDLMVTEKEKDLASFILGQKRSSLTPQELFRKSYQLNQGNVYLSLLTIENVLANGWLHPKRGEFKHTQNLKPFGKVFGSQGDVFGHWYHMFGMIYYGYEKGGFHAAVAGKVEAVGSSVISKFQNERQENRINMSAGKVGSNLRKYISAREENKEFKLEEKEVKEESDLKKLLVKKVDKILKREEK